MTLKPHNPISTMTAANKAVWVPSKGAEPIVQEAEVPKPGQGEVVIEVCWDSNPFA